MTGYIDTPKDSRDFKAYMAFEDIPDIKIPEKFETSFQPPFEKQLCGNCVAQTLANIMEVFYYNQCGVHENFSVGFIYGNRDEKESHTEGMTGYQACGHLVKDGDVKSAVFDNPGSAPSIVEKVNEFKAKCPDWREKAYVPPLYIRTEDVNTVKKFMMKYNAPVMGIMSARAFSGWSYLHAMALYGWDGNTAVFQNSWGENSPQKIVKVDFDKVIDFWIILPYFISGFSDLKPEHWAFESINYCADKKYLLGYPDNSFRPDAPMTRAEFCVTVKRLRLLGVMT